MSAALLSIAMGVWFVVKACDTAPNHFLFIVGLGLLIVGLGLARVHDPMRRVR